jgi:hypothetical protein
MSEEVTEPNPMTEKEMQQFLISMGYRKMKDSIWGKPIGYTILIFDFVTNVIRQTFVGKNGKVMTYDSREINIDFFEDELKQFEAWGIKEFLDLCPEKKFNFISQKEVFELMLQGDIT